VFSIGEMTAHPKYYSYIGLVAPADRKAVYMGYAFLYGVIGSLIGSNLGGWFFFVSAFSGDTAAYKTMVQAVFMILIGAGGIIISLRHPAPPGEDPDRMDA
jgi:MFS family permease